MQDNLQRINRIYPWLAGLTNNLIFYVVINTVWLTNVKGFDAMQVTLLEVCVSLAVRVFMSPILKLSERIGNTRSMRLGVISLFVTSVLLTFGTEYWVFLLAMIFQALSVLLTAMRDVLIQNNLNRAHKGNEYINISSRAHLVYTGATMVASLLVGIFFTEWQSLPMILGTIICGIGVIVLLGFFLNIDFRNRMLLMASGFVLLPVIRDPLHIFCQTVLLDRVDKSDRKDALVYLVIMQQAGKVLLGLLASAILLFLPLQYAIIMLAIASIPVVGLAFRLNRLLKRASE